MMMTLSCIQRLSDYHRWANDRLLSVVAELNPEEFRRVIAGGHGSVRGTLVHLVSAEWGWLERCGGPARGPRLDPESNATPEAVIEIARTVEAKMATFLTQLTEADLVRQIEFGFAPGESNVLQVGQLLEHAHVHGIHHRGQLALLLRLLGRAPGNFDLLYFDIANDELRQTSSP